MYLIHVYCIYSIYTLLDIFYSLIVYEQSLVHCAQLHLLTVYSLFLVHRTQKYSLAITCQFALRVCTCNLTAIPGEMGHGIFGYNKEQPFYSLWKYAKL